MKALMKPSPYERKNIFKSDVTQSTTTGWGKKKNLKNYDKI
jgi:hypothetical protein